MTIYANSEKSQNVEDAIRRRESEFRASGLLISSIIIFILLLVIMFFIPDSVLYSNSQFLNSSNATSSNQEVKRNSYHQKRSSYTPLKRGHIAFILSFIKPGVGEMYARPEGDWFGYINWAY